MNATISRETPIGDCVKRLVGRCRNCGGRKRARDRHLKYCEDCRVSMKIPKREWVKPNYLFIRKDFGLSAYWGRNTELLALTLTMSQH